MRIDRPVDCRQRVRIRQGVTGPATEFHNGSSEMTSTLAIALAPATASTKDVILDAAERVFGRSGFAGSSMREISTEADVAQALLHYHFKCKDALYREVFRRRSTVIVEYRRAKLRELFESGAAPTLEDVLAIVATPLLAIFGNAGQDTRYYLQMVGEVTVATDERSVEIVSTFYDPIGKEMVAAFMRVLPGLSEERANWAYLFAIGARLQAHAHNHRAARLGPKNTGRSPHELLVPFLAAGIRALANLPDGGVRAKSGSGRRTGRTRTSA